MIISSSLNADQEKSLVEVLGKYKKTIEWTMTDIKEINPSLCMHKIMLEDYYNNSIEQQRWLNPIMKEVVKNKSSNGWMLESYTQIRQIVGKPNTMYLKEKRYNYCSKWKEWTHSYKNINMI